MDSADVAIVGSGVAGAASACALSARGLDVLVLERRDLTRDPNRGDALDSVSMGHLERWGAAEEIVRRGPSQLRELLLTRRDGATLGRIALPDPITMLNHAEIEAALVETARRRGVVFRRCLAQGLRPTDEGAVLETDAGPVRARLIVAADGASSAVRRELGIEVERNEYAHSLVIVHAPRPSWLAPNAGWVMFHPRGGLLIVPTSPPGRCRVAIFTAPQETRAWLTADADRIRELLSERCELLSELAVERGHGSHLYRVARQHALRYFSGQVALIGDAAHVTPPSGGQGMNLAIRDAATLASLTAPALESGSLAEYELQRRKRNAQALGRAHRLHRMRAGRRAYPLAVCAAAAFTHTPGLSGWAMRRARPA